MKRNGFSLLEVLVGMTILCVIFAGGATVLLVGQASWTTTNTNIQLQENSRLALTRISKELQESGTDSFGTLQVAILDNAGANGTDVIRFSIPICVCGEDVIDDSGDVEFWGAPLKWGSHGCSNIFTVESDGKITICHRPPGNPTNEQTIRISPSALNAHVAHGDYPGTCSVCTTDNNRTIEYRLNSENQLIRRILDNAALTVSENLVATNINDFQTVLSADFTNVVITIDLKKDANNKRVCTLSRSQTVYLRN